MPLYHNIAARKLVVGLLLLTGPLVGLVIWLASTLVATGAAVAFAGAPPTQSPGCAPNWEMVQSPNPRTSNRLEAVSALAPNDVWAVGYYFDFAQTPDYTLTMHWDGSQWTQVPSPNPAAGSYLEDVVALASDNVWAVGYSYIGTAQTLIEHWNGSQWSIVPSPNQGPSTNELMGIDAISPTDIWAVGNTPGSHNTVTLHWDGSQWTVVPSLSNDFSNTYVLGDVAAIAPNDVWAVGYYYPESGAHRTITMHWDGTSWTRIPSPNPGAYVSRLFDVTAVAANEVWAVGHYSNNGGSSYQTLTMKWDGTAWTVVPSPSLGAYETLYDVEVAADGEVWAVGAYHVQNFPTSPAHTLALRWDGSTWQTVSSPDGFRFNNELYGIASTPQGDLWAVGRSYNSYDTPWDTLILRNRCVVGTPTPAPPTVTRTATPTATPGTPSSCSSPSFGPATPYAVGDGPERLAVGDFNHDGNLDLAVANRPANTISLLLGNGGGGFGPVTNFAIGTEPAGLAVADFNRDGNLDLAAAGYGLNQARVLLGDGVGGFGSVVGYTTGSGPAGIATGDFNHDGNPDLVTANSFADTMSVLLGNGAGGFGSATPYNLGWIPLDIAVSDFNGDGNADVAASNSFDYDVSVRLGNGTGGFGSLTNYSVGVNPISLAVGDFNHDGNPDWVTSNQDSRNVSVRLGNGAGGFGPVTNFPAGNGSAAVAISDFNIDGNPDLAVASVPGNVLVLLGNGAGGFGPPTSIAAGSGPRAATTGDFNRDGKADLAVTDNSSDTVVVLLNSCPAVGATPTATVLRPTITPLPATMTITPGPTLTRQATATATMPPGLTATTTPCTASFSDVPPDNTFYAFIRCLICRRIVGGYPCGGPGEPCPGLYFRPGNNVTRGQVSKIVAESAQFTDLVPSTQQTFADVTPGSTFHLWIERLSGRGIIGGYPCGGPFEPCQPPTNRPYFRPNNPVTRDQLAKIVSGAAGYSETPTAQTFADVPPASTFYLWVERLSSRSIIGGYPCGSVGEPCVAPGNRPYFRPNNPTTRGQLSKIAASAFFPNCATPARRR